MNANTSIGAGQPYSDNYRVWSRCPDLGVFGQPPGRASRPYSDSHRALVTMSSRQAIRTGTGFVDSQVQLRYSDRHRAICEIAAAASGILFGQAPGYLERRCRDAIRTKTGCLARPSPWLHVGYSDKRRVAEGGPLPRLPSRQLPRASQLAGFVAIRTKAGSEQGSSWMLHSDICRVCGVTPWVVLAESFGQAPGWIRAGQRLLFGHGPGGVSREKRLLAMILLLCHNS